MPPKAAKRPLVKLLKFGEILFDENKSVILLCSYCSIDFVNLQDFQQHLKNCFRVRHIFKAPNSLKLNCEEGTQLLTTIKKNTKELFIYGFSESSTSEKPGKINDNVTDLLRIEQELLDPRWYTDSVANSDSKKQANKKTASYNELIEEVTPFVQFKENVKSTVSSRPIRGAVKVPEKNLNRSTKDISQNKLKSLPLTTPQKAEPRDKRQTLQRGTVQQEISSSGSTNKQTAQVVKQIKNINPAVVENKATSRSVTKVVTVVETTKSGRELRATSLAGQNLPPKRKAESEIFKLSQVADNNFALKKRKTVEQQSQTSTQAKSVLATPPKFQNQSQNSKSIQIQKCSPSKTPVVLSNGNTIASKKNENNTDPNANKLLLNKSRSEILNNNKQWRPQVQPQAKLEASQHQLKSPIIPAKKPPESASIQIQKTIPVKIQTFPAATSTPIIQKNNISHVKNTVHSPANNNQETAEILNKLQTLGLKVKRTNPNPPKVNNSNEQALEIIKKLQSKGMNVKIVQKTSAPPILKPFTTIHNTLSPIKVSSGNTLNNISLISPEKNTTSVATNVLESKPNFRKNVLIKKCTS